MPVGEFIGEIILRPVLEVVFHGLSYWTGFLALKALSFGNILTKSPYLESLDVPAKAK